MTHNSWPAIPGVPGAGHITARGGYWHPGRAEGCVKCQPPTRREVQVPAPGRNVHNGQSPREFEADGWVSLDAVARALAQPGLGIPAQVVNSGGNTAGVFVGTATYDEDGVEWFDLVIGPGYFEADGTAWGSPEELSYGPDRDPATGSPVPLYGGAPQVAAAVAITYRGLHPRPRVNVDDTVLLGDGVLCWVNAVRAGQPVAATAQHDPAITYTAADLERLGWA
jgi:hypothetical protein